jgi:CopG family nickel-responsive transcriptional regulator
VSDLTRFSVSLEEDLLREFDRFCEQGRFATRSEAIRQLLRQTLTAEVAATDAGDVMATLTLVYDHHRTHLAEKLLHLQHEVPDQVVATTHVHLDHDRCLEVIILRGRASRLEKFAAELRGQKGVHAGRLVVAGPAEHHHHHH